MLWVTNATPFFLKHLNRIDQPDRIQLLTFALMTLMLKTFVSQNFWMPLSVIVTENHIVGLMMLQKKGSVVLARPGLSNKQLGLLGPPDRMDR
jgi:hypothetical protein